MNNIYLVIIALVIVVVLVTGILLFKKKKPRKNIELNDLIFLFDKKNIQTINFVRNKIVVDFIDVKKFDVEKLHQKGALGVNIVGDKIKFYFEGDNEQNETIYNNIKEHIER